MPRKQRPVSATATGTLTLELGAAVSATATGTLTLELGAPVTADRAEVAPAPQRIESTVRPGCLGAVTTAARSTRRTCG